MRNYGKVISRFWTAGTGRRLRGDQDAQVMALYLMTCASSSMTGIYNIAPPTIAHETGLSLSRVERALARLEEERFAFFDHDEDLVWITNLVVHQVGDSLKPNDNQVLGLKRELALFDGHRFVSWWIGKHGRAMSVSLEGVTPPTDTPWEAPPKPLTKALRSQDQDQDQDQDQEQEQEAPRVCVPAPARVAPAVPTATVLGDFLDPPPNLDDQGYEPVIPDSPDRLLHCMRVAAEAHRPDLSFWASGTFAARDAREFFESIPASKRAAVVALLPARIEAFFRSSDRRLQEEGWSFREFMRRFNSLAARAAPKSRYERHEPQTRAPNLDDFRRAQMAEAEKQGRAPPARQPPMPPPESAAHTVKATTTGES